MGYKRPMLRLVFTDEEFTGLEVRAKRFGIGEILKLDEMLNLMREGDPSRFDDLHKLLDRKILSWNLEEEDADGVDRPVPKNAEEIGNLDQRLLVQLIREIRKASVEIPAPLEQPSQGGVPAVEESIPMETLSASP